MVPFIYLSCLSFQGIPWSLSECQGVAESTGKQQKASGSALSWMQDLVHKISQVCLKIHDIKRRAKDRLNSLPLLKTKKIHYNRHSSQEYTHEKDGKGYVQNTYNKPLPLQSRYNHDNPACHNDEKPHTCLLPGKMPLSHEPNHNPLLPSDQTTPLPKNKPPNQDQKDDMSASSPESMDGSSSSSQSLASMRMGLPSLVEW